jgi:hypothetical protein
MVTFCLALSPVALAHSTKVEHVTVIEMEGNRYGILYAAPPPGRSEFAAPILPDRCQWVDPLNLQITETSTSLVFEAKGGPLSAEDTLILPWHKNGVMVFMKWQDGSTGYQFFLSGPRGIVVEMALLKAGSGSTLAAARKYAWLGLEHILGGVDHLLFVAGLLFLVRDLKRLILTVTAFTLAHSITLAASVFGWVKLPSEPVEAIIALSIVLLAVEIVNQHRGMQGITSRYPWLISFGFGLVHGLGFAGALGELGLPPSEVPAALLFFNLGVEAGQLFFIAALLLLAWPFRKAKVGLLLKWVVVPHYALGIVSAYWLLDRTLAMLPG